MDLRVSRQIAEALVEVHTATVYDISAADSLSLAHAAAAAGGALYPQSSGALTVSHAARVALKRLSQGINDVLSPAHSVSVLYRNMNPRIADALSLGQTAECVHRNLNPSVVDGAHAGGRGDDRHSVVVASPGGRAEPVAECDRGDCLPASVRQQPTGDCGCRRRGVWNGARGQRPERSDASADQCGDRPSPPCRRRMPWRSCNNSTIPQAGPL